MGSRLPSRQDSHAAKYGKRSMDSAMIGPLDDVPPHRLEAIQSVQTGSDENITTMSNGARFTQEQLDEAVKKAAAGTA